MRIKVLIKLIIGLIVILAIVLGLTLVLNRRITKVASQTASIQSGTYTLGSEYSGWVSALNIEPGEKVSKGQHILSLQSDEVKYNLLSSGNPQIESINQQISKDGTITLLAPESGTVTSLDVRDHSFVTAGSIVAVVNVAGSQYVEASVVLESRDYARLHVGTTATVILPDQSRYSGTVKDITVTSQAGETNAQLHIDCPALRSTGSNVLTSPGTPVTVMADLDDHGAISELITSVQLFLQRIGV